MNETNQTLSQLQLLSSPWVSADLGSASLLSPMALSNGNASIGGHEMQGWQLTARYHWQRCRGSLLQPLTAKPPPHCLSVSASYTPALTPIQSENRLDRGLKHFSSLLFIFWAFAKTTWQISITSVKLGNCWPIYRWNYTAEVQTVSCSSSSVNPGWDPWLRGCKFYQFQFISFGSSVHQFKIQGREWLTFHHKYFLSKY